MKITKSSNAILRSNVPSSGRTCDRSIGALKIHMFGEQGDVDDLMVVLNQVQRNKRDA
jgi:hypothetical protein